MMDHYYQSSYPQNAAYWQQGFIDTRFEAGDQTLLSMMYGDNQYYQSRRFFFNMIKRLKNMIGGYQRKNRKSTVAIPVFQDDNLADEYSQVLKWSETLDGFQEYLSQAFDGSNVTGMSWLHLYPDYTLDPVNGDLFTDKVSYCNAMVDPYFRKQDMTDCNFWWRRRWNSKEQTKVLIPKYANEIDKLRPVGAKDGRFPLQAELMNITNNKLWTYDEFYYRATRPAQIIIDPKTQEAMLWEPDADVDDPEAELAEVMRLQPWLKLVKKEIPTVKLAIVVGGKTIYDGPNHLSTDSYPCVPSLAYYEPDIQSYAWRCQGIVRGLRDVQYLYNLRRVIELDICQSQINSGWIYPVDAVVDPKAFRQSGQGFLVPLKSGHLPNEIQKIEPPNIPQGMLELSRMLGEDFMKISGVNEELLGSATDDKAGILSMLRQGAGLTTLQMLFDKLDYTQRLYGKLRLQAIIKNFSKAKISSILGHAPSEKFFVNNSMKYNIQVEEGSYCATQRQLELQQLLHFKELGVPIANKSIIRAAIITNKAQIEEDMNAEQEQQNQQAQAEAQAQMQNDQVENQLKQAKTRSEMSKAHEIMMNAGLKKAETIESLSNAEYKQTEAEYKLVEIMMSLEGQDLENLRSSFELAQSIKMANSQNVSSVGGQNERTR